MNTFINITNELIIGIIESLPKLLALDSMKAFASLLCISFIVSIILAFTRYRK